MRLRRVGRDQAGLARAPRGGAGLSGAGRDADWLRDLFEPFGAISVRRMFGGSGLYRDSVMFGLVSDGDIYLKSDDIARERFRAAGCTPFTFAKDGRKVTTSYWSMPSEALDDGEVLKDWAELSFAAALRARKPKTKR